MTISRVAGDAEAVGKPAHDVFVSYSTNDKPVADAIVSRLEQAGIRCWVAPRDIIPGRVWGEAILHAIETTRLMVVVMSGAANASRQVLREVERAVANDVVVIPFRIESVEPTGAMAYFLASEHWLDAMTPPLDTHIAQLVGVVQALVGGIPTAADSRIKTTSAVQPSPDIGPTHAIQQPATTRRLPPRVLIGGLVGAIAIAGLGLMGAMALGPSTPATSVPSLATPSPPVDVRYIPETALATGDCLLTPAAYDDASLDQFRFWKQDLGAWPSVWSVVPCTEPHGAEAFFVGDIWGPDATFPDDAALDARWDDACRAEFERYVGVVLDRSGMDMSGWTGYGSDGWAQGMRDISCIAYERSGADLVGSIRGSSR